MLTMKGERTGQVAEGYFEVLLTADEATPNRLYLYGIQSMVGDLEKTMDRWYYRFTLGDEVAALDVECTPDEWEVALQCDRWFAVRPDDVRVGDLPPMLRKYGQQAVDVLKEYSSQQ